MPEFVTAKVREITSSLPGATFTVEQLSSERRLYDPFLIVSYGEESYYIEVWNEPVFEHEHTRDVRGVGFSFHAELKADIRRVAELPTLSWTALRENILRHHSLLVGLPCARLSMATLSRP